MKLSHADRYVAAIAGALQPVCKRIEVAGSVRRRRPFVNDIDFVVLEPDPFKFRGRARLNATVIKDGPDILIIRLRDGTQVDFYFAHGPTADLVDSKPGNWGSVMLCRTGSKEHNIYLAQQAQRLGYKWETMIGITSAERGAGSAESGKQILAGETEESIFTALGLPFIEPEKRERT